MASTKWGLFGLLIAGCTGSIGDPAGESGRPDEREEPTIRGDAAQPRCQPGEELTVGPAPLRRLTAAQLRNTIEDVLGLTEAEAPALEVLADIPDGSAGGFASGTQAADTQVIRSYLSMAEGLATSLVEQRLSDWISCDIDQEGCVRPFIAQIGRLLFRRPLSESSDGELERHVGIYRAMRAAYGARVGLETALAALLSSPSFLYLVEDVELDHSDGSLVPLTPFALATRLSYFLWSSAPDAELLSAAETGVLDTLDGLDAQARRMLDDPRALRTFGSFHEQWLGLTELDRMSRDDPQWSDGLRDSMRAETLRFIEHVLTEGDARFETLLAGRYSFIDSSLAEIYGIPAPAEPFARVELDGDRRVGLLTHASVMTRLGAAFPEVHRGLFVRDRLLCDPPPPPPEDLELTGAAVRLSTEPCKSCHVRMDPIGFAFARYDDLGRYRAEEAGGEPIDQHGEVISPDGALGDEVTGTFAGPGELASRLSHSPDVEACIARQWFRFATGRVEDTGDACAIFTVAKSFGESGGDLRALLVAIATSPAFGARSVEELEGLRAGDTP